MTRGGTRPGAGRPPGRDLTVAVQVRCRESQREQMRALAERAGLSLSEYLRRLGLGEPLTEPPPST